MMNTSEQTDLQGLPHWSFNHEQVDTVGRYALFRKYDDKQGEFIVIPVEDRTSLTRGGGAKRKNTTKSEMDALTLSKSKQRARSKVRQKCMSLGVTHLMTLTQTENETSIDESLKAFHYFNKLMRIRWKDWAYVATPEYQKRGSVHFHLAVIGFYHAGTVRKLWRKALKGKGGNVDIQAPKHLKQDYRSGSTPSPRKIAAYISKYIIKDETVGFNRKRYYSGGKFTPPQIFKGFSARGLYMPKIAREIFNKLVKRHPTFMWESEDEWGVFYFST